MKFQEETDIASRRKEESVLSRGDDVGENGDGTRSRVRPRTPTEGEMTKVSKQKNLKRR